MLSSHTSLSKSQRMNKLARINWLSSREKINTYPPTAIPVHKNFAILETIITETSKKPHHRRGVLFNDFYLHEILTLFILCTHAKLSITLALVEYKA